MALVKTFTDAWATLLAASYATIGIAAGHALYQQWQAQGLIPSEAEYAGAASEADDADLQAAIQAKADSITQTTGDRLQSALDDALAAGGTAALLVALSGLYDAWTGADGESGSRADVIGWTEGQGAWGAGLLDAANTAAGDYGLSVMQTWNAVMDARTRPEHADADGQQVALGDTFSVGGEDLYYPGGGGDPANNINCRCWLEIDGQPLDAEM